MPELVFPPELLSSIARDVIGDEASKLNVRSIPNWFQSRPAVLSTRKETMLKSSFLFQRVPETSKVLKFIEVLRKVRPILEPCRTAASTCSSVTVRTKLVVELVTMPTLEADPSTDSAHHSACADDCDTCTRACEVQPTTPETQPYNARMVACRLEATVGSDDRTCESRPRRGRNHFNKVSQVIDSNGIFHIQTAAPMERSSFARIGVALTGQPNEGQAER